MVWADRCNGMDSPGKGPIGFIGRSCLVIFSSIYVPCDFKYWNGAVCLKLDFVSTLVRNIDLTINWIRYFDGCTRIFIFCFWFYWDPVFFLKSFFKVSRKTSKAIITLNTLFVFSMKPCRKLWRKVVRSPRVHVIVTDFSGFHSGNK